MRLCRRFQQGFHICITKTRINKLDGNPPIKRVSKLRPDTNILLCHIFLLKNGNSWKINRFPRDIKHALLKPWRLHGIFLHLHHANDSLLGSRVESNSLLWRCVPEQKHNSSDIAGLQINIVITVIIYHILCNTLGSQSRSGPPQMNHIQNAWPESMFWLSYLGIHEVLLWHT